MSLAFTSVCERKSIQWQDIFAMANSVGTMGINVDLMRMESGCSTNRPDYSLSAQDGWYSSCVKPAQFNLCGICVSGALGVGEAWSDLPRRIKRDPS